MAAHRLRGDGYGNRSCVKATWVLNIGRMANIVWRNFWIVFIDESARDVEEFVVARPKIDPLHTRHSAVRRNGESEAAIGIANVAVVHDALENAAIAPGAERRRVDEPLVRSSLGAHIDVDRVESTEFRRRFPLNKKRYRA